MPANTVHHRRGSRAALALAVLPVLLAGCGSAKETPKAEETTGPGWLVMEQGTRPASPVPRYGKASPTPDLTLPPLPKTSSPTRKPGSSCAPAPRNAGPINGLDVRPSSTSAIVTWYHPGGGNIVDYRVTAISQDLRVGAQREVGWTQAVPARCGPVSATVPGLDPGTPYVFSVDAVMTRTGLDGTYTRTVARSGVVSTT